MKCSRLSCGLQNFLTVNALGVPPNDKCGLRSQHPTCLPMRLVSEEGWVHFIGTMGSPICILALSGRESDSLLGSFYCFFMHMQKQLLSDFLQLSFDFRLVIAPYPHESLLAYGAPFKIRISIEVDYFGLNKPHGFFDIRRGQQIVDDFDQHGH